MELVKTVQVLMKNKASTSLKPAEKGRFATSQTHLICSLKVLTKPTLSIVLCTEEKNKHPLKFNLF
jgi:hypothetical protein